MSVPLPDQLSPDYVPLDPPRWPKGPGICPVANLPAFETEKELRAFMGALGDGAISIDRIGQCKACGKFHAVTHARELSGASSNSGTRQWTLKIPEAVEKHNAEISARRKE